MAVLGQRGAVLGAGGETRAAVDGGHRDHVEGGLAVVAGGEAVALHPFSWLLLNRPLVNKGRRTEWRGRCPAGGVHTGIHQPASTVATSSGVGC